MIAVDPVAIPPTTTVPHPMRTKANVPMNSAMTFFMATSIPRTRAGAFLVVHQFKIETRGLY